MRTLSAIGSRILPRSVTRSFLRARYPSSLSVIAATPKITTATRRQVTSSPPSCINAHPKTGTRAMRTIVMMFAMFHGDAVWVLTRPA